MKLKRDSFHTIGAKEYSCIQSLKELTRNVQVLYNCLSCSDKALDICSMTNLENKPMIKKQKLCSFSRRHMVHTATYGYIKFMLGDAFLCSKVYKKMIISPPETSVPIFNTSV